MSGMNTSQGCSQDSALGGVATALGGAKGGAG